MYEPYQDHEGKWRWRFVAHNGRIMADSGQGYSRRGDAIKAIRRVRTLMSSGSINIK